MSIVHIKGQFDLYQTITAFVPGHVRISRTDGQKVPYLKTNKFASTNWKKFCDEVDTKLMAVNEAKRTLRLYGFLPFLGLVATIMFVITYTAATNRQFLFRRTFGSIFTICIAITFTATIIILEYRMRLKCAKAWREVNYTCRRFSTNVIQFRLNHDKYQRTCSGFTSRKYFITVLTPSDDSFLGEKYPAPKTRKKLMTPIFEEDELKRADTPMVSTSEPIDVDSFITNPISSAPVSSRTLESTLPTLGDIDETKVVLDLEDMEPKTKYKGGLLPEEMEQIKNKSRGLDLEAMEQEMVNLQADDPNKFTTSMMMDLDDDSYFDDDVNEVNHMATGSNPYLSQVLATSMHTDIDLLDDSKGKNSEFDTIFEQDDDGKDANEVMSDEENPNHMVDNAFNENGFLPKGFLTVEPPPAPLTPPMVKRPKYKNKRVSWNSLGQALSKQVSRRKRFNSY